jgi:hypothetical protein
MDVVMHVTQAVAYSDRFCMPLARHCKEWDDDAFLARQKDLCKQLHQLNLLSKCAT